MARIWRYFTEFGSFWGALRKSVRDDVVVKKRSRSLSHLLMSFLFTDCRIHTYCQCAIVINVCSKLLFL